MPADEFQASAKRARYRRPRIVERYDRNLGAYADRTDQEVVARYLAGESGLVLDVPCGTGRFDSLLESAGCRVISADYSEAMLTMVAARGSHSVVRTDAFRLPFVDATFDGVLCARLVFHYPDPYPLLEEIGRVVRPGGFLIFDTLNPISARRLIEPLLRRLPGGIERRVWFLSRSRVEDALARVGCRVIERQSRMILPTRAYRIVPRPLHGRMRRIERRFPESLRVLDYWKASRTS